MIAPINFSAGPDADGVIDGGAVAILVHGVLVLGDDRAIAGLVLQRRQSASIVVGVGCAGAVRERHFGGASGRIVSIDGVGAGSKGRS